jgi:hypothetical protein
VHGGVGTRDVAQKGDQRSEKQLDDCDGISSWRINDCDPESGGDIEINVVNADSGATNDLEACGLLEKLTGNPRRAAPDDCIVVSNALEELLSRECRNLVNLEARIGSEKRNALGVNLIGDQHGVGHLRQGCLCLDSFFSRLELTVNELSVLTLRFTAVVELN